MTIEKLRKMKEEDIRLKGRDAFLVARTAMYVF